MMLRQVAADQFENLLRQDTILKYYQQETRLL